MMCFVAWDRFFDQHGNKITVPAPSIDRGFPWLSDWVAEDSPDLARVEFEEIQAPPGTGANGKASFTIPSDYFGRQSHVCFSRTGHANHSSRCRDRCSSPSTVRRTWTCRRRRMEPPQSGAYASAKIRR